MALPVSPYICQEEGTLRIVGTRVGLDCIITAFQEGEQPEKIAESFPTVTLAQVYGAIAYYLENKPLIDQFFSDVECEFDRRVRPLSETNPALFTRLEEARRRMGSKRA
jgi:uncharacterized protein (DUF433 family)